MTATPYYTDKQIAEHAAGPLFVWCLTDATGAIFGPFENLRTAQRFIEDGEHQLASPLVAVQVINGDPRPAPVTITEALERAHVESGRDA